MVITTRSIIIVGYFMCIISHNCQCLYSDFLVDLPSTKITQNPSTNGTSTDYSSLYDQLTSLLIRQNRNLQDNRLNSTQYIQATAIYVDKAEFPLSKLAFKLTLKLAIEALDKNLASKRVKVSLNVRNAASCSNQYAAALAAEEYYTRRSRLFILSGCDDAIKSVSRLASIWQIPLMTGAGFMAELNDKSTHKTLIRVAFSLKAAVEFLVKIMKTYQWQRVNLIVDESDQNSFALKQSIESNIADYDTDDFRVALNVLPFDLASLLGQSVAVKSSSPDDMTTKINSTLDRYENVSVSDSWPNEFANKTIRDILRQSSLYSRVNVLLIPQEYIRTFMLSVFDQNMANGRYTFISIPLLLFANDDSLDSQVGSSGDQSKSQSFATSSAEDVLIWRSSTSSRNSQARKAFESLMSIYVKTPTSRLYTYYLKNLSDLANSNLNKYINYSSSSSKGSMTRAKESKRIQINVNPYTGSLYDCLQIYGKALNQSLSNIEKEHDSGLVRKLRENIHANLSNYMRNNRYENMLTGNFLINQNGDRETDYTLNDMNQATGKFRPVILFKGETKDIERLAPISWSSDSNVMATDDDVDCQLTNSCPRQGLPRLVTTLALTSSPFVLIVAIVVYLVYRHVSLESQLVDYWWKIKYEDIEILQSRRKQALDGTLLNDDKTSVVSSINASSKTHSDQCAKTTITNVSTTICATYGNITLGNYKLGRVALKPIHKFHQSRRMMLELRTMKSINHNNLCRFIGIVADESNLALVTEFCPRGSLREFFHNESMVIDWTFKYSIINDIMAGLLHLHSSALEFHGRLKSGNCLVNSRFSVKLSDYGLHSLFEQLDDDSDDSETHLLKKQVWRAPEHLRSTGKRCSKKGDVYSLGLLLYEVVTGNLPFYDTDKADYVMPLKNLCNELKLGGPNQITGPHFDQIDLTENENLGVLVDLMKKCVQYNPESRPTLLEISASLKRVTHGVTSKKLLQNLSDRMEQYTSNLESLVDAKLSTLIEEKLRTEELLYQFVPKSIASLLREGQAIEPEAFDCVTVFFSDIVGFTSLSSESTPMQVIDFLSDLYLCFDETLENYDIFKIDIIGDAYIVASGLPHPNEGKHVVEIARAALNLRERLATFKIPHRPERNLEMRVGIHSGPCVGGIVGGVEMPKYCVFGETLSTGKFMESSGLPMKIHITEESKKLLDDFGLFKMEPRTPKISKDGLQIQTYWLEEEYRLET